MGTRNLTMVFADGEFKLAQYGQWDGYPEGNGYTVLEFCRKVGSRASGWTNFKAQLEMLDVLTSDQVGELWKGVGATGDFVSIHIADRFEAKYPTLSRNTGADILHHIDSAKEKIPVFSDLAFAADSLMCEWAWLIDLDAMKLEAYQGFNKTALGDGDRFASLPLPERRNKDYFQVKLAGSWPLSDLPTKKDFVSALKDKDDED